MVQSIPEMHKYLEELNAFFGQSTAVFIQTINSHPGQFTTQDSEEFREVVEDIRSYALTKINSFFDNKHTSKASLYGSHITAFSETGQNINAQLVQFRNELEAATIQMKREQNRRENLLDSFSRKYSEHIVFKRVWKVLTDNQRERQEGRRLDEKMEGLYRRNLCKKAFFPWRTLTYKEGFENTVRDETQKDILSIHQQYQSIIHIMKTKIAETDDMIKLKRAAKGEFAFALSKNLLKSISNLSLEVMSLNQMALRDGECDESETKQFMRTVDSVIGEKLGKVREYKRSMLGEGGCEEEEEERGKKKKRITFV